MQTPIIKQVDIRLGEGGRYYADVQVGDIDKYATGVWVTYRTHGSAPTRAAFRAFTEPTQEASVTLSHLAPGVTYQVDAHVHGLDGEVSASSDPVSMVIPANTLTSGDLAWWAISAGRIPVEVSRVEGETAYVRVETWAERSGQHSYMVVPVDSRSLSLRQKESDA